MSQLSAVAGEPRTQAPFDQPTSVPNLSWTQQRDWLRARLKAQPTASYSDDEVAAHFDSMPATYWETVTESDLAWALELVHRFLTTVAVSNLSATMPVVDWRHRPERDGTLLMLCTWDRRGLLAKAAACLSAVNLNIQQATIYTRTDHIVLDVFRVCDPDMRGPATPSKLEQMTFLLDGALSEPPRFASVWACSRHKFIARPPRMPPCVRFDNESAPNATLVELRASDRLGLLYDVLQAIADAGLNVAQAGIQTEAETVRDILHVTDADGRKILDPARLQILRRAIEVSAGEPC
jgi:[protein-PII] uridylyltransferase